MKFLLLATGAVGGIYLVHDLLPHHVAQAAFFSIPLLFVAAIALAVLRHRLYDVDLVIRRSTVFVLVTALVFGIYVAVAAAIGASAPQPAVLGASVIVAAVAEPARQRIQRAVTRLLFGRRDDPLQALASLRDRMRSAVDGVRLGQAVVDVLPQLVRSPYVTVELLHDGVAREVAQSSTPAAEAVEFPLIHQGELLGTLHVGRRAPGEAYGRADIALLVELSHQIAAAAYEVRLHGDLRTAHDRAVRAAGLERERLRRDLHDRLAPMLIGTGLAVHGLRRQVTDDAATGPELEQIARQLRDASAEVRRIVDGLQPATLMELGLVETIRDHLDRLAGIPDVPTFNLTAHHDTTRRAGATARRTGGRLLPAPRSDHQRPAARPRHQRNRADRTQPHRAAHRPHRRRPWTHRALHRGHRDRLHAPAGPRTRRHVRPRSGSPRRDPATRHLRPAGGLMPNHDTGIRVVVADDHHVFRLGMRKLLDSGTGIHIVGEATDTASAIATTLDLKPDVVIMDLNMPGPGGIEATQQILRHLPDVRILVLTMHADNALVGRALRAGARGYLVKDAPPEDIVRAIEAVRANQAILDPAVTGALTAPATAGRTIFPQLTDREFDVLERVASGASNDAIATRLGISVKTVQNHVSSVLLKLGVASRAAAVARARDAGVGMSR